LQRRLRSGGLLDRLRSRFGRQEERSGLTAGREI
jgi:hypothetical protein